MRRLLFAALVLGLASGAAAQHEGVLAIDSDLAWFLQRQQTAGRIAGAPMDLQPLSAYEAQQILDSLALDPSELSAVDRQLLARYRGEAAGPGVAAVRSVAPALYENGHTFFSKQGDDWGLEAEPLIYVVAGQTRRTETDDQTPEAPVWQSSRGARIGGHLGRHFFFDSRIVENQRRPALLDTIDADPATRAGLTAPRVGDINLAGGTTYDYFTVSGSVGYRDKYIEARLGRDQNRWGPGHNSLHLSNYASSYDQLQLRAKVWRVQFASVITRFNDPVRPTTRDNLFLPSKYGAFHRLQLSIPGGIDLGLSESVILADDTTDGLRKGFDPAYLNPFIFFRAAEAQVGSPDNVLLAADIAWRPVGGVRTYGQIIIDELRFSEIGSDWWGNKYGWLAGVHLVDPGIPNLDLRVEYARLRPYLYSHRSEWTAYTHWADGLGHPAGPNSVDVSVFGRYRPLATVEAAFNVAYTRRGLNTETENFGSDPRVSFDTRIDDYGIVTLQGVEETSWLGEARLAWEVLPGLFAEGAMVGQVFESDLGERRAVSLVGGLRWGIPYRSERW